MIEAKSIYLGGDIVSAAECDYSSYERLGLKCPFCDSAVFLRSASVRKIKGVERPIGAYFAHFPSGYTDNFDCEARSNSKAGRDRIEQIKIEARNQRLKTYNAKLWALISTDRNISRQLIAKVRKHMDGHYLDRVTKLVRREITRNLEDLYVSIDLAMLEIDRMRPESLNEIFVLSKSESKIEYDTQQTYFCDCDRRLHQAICYEVIEFLATNSGGWALNKLVTIACQIQGKNGGVPVAQVRETPPYTIALTIAYFLVGTHWTEIIEKFETL